MSLLPKGGRGRWTSESEASLVLQTKFQDSLDYTQRSPAWNKKQQQQQKPTHGGK